MTWTRFESRYPQSRKVKPLTDGAFRADVEGICWANDESTDGLIRSDEIQLIGDGKRKPKHAAELVRRGRWHAADEQPCPSPKCPHDGTAPDGWVIHDFHDYNPTAAQVRAERTAKAERQKRWRDRKSGRYTGDASTPASVDAPTDASRDTSRDATPHRSAPPRSEGSGGGAPPSGQAERPPPASGRNGAGDGRNQNQPPTPPAAPPVETLADVRQRIAAAASKHRNTDTRRADPLAELDAAAGGEQPAAAPPPTCPECGVDLDPDGACRHRDCPRYGATVHPLAA